MLHLVTTHLEIKGELLLERELAAEFCRRPLPVTVVLLRQSTRASSRP